MCRQCGIKFAYKFLSVFCPVCVVQPFCYHHQCASSINYCLLCVQNVETSTLKKSPFVSTTTDTNASTVVQSPIGLCSSPATPQAWSVCLFRFVHWNPLWRHSFFLCVSVYFNVFFFLFLPTFPLVSSLMLRCQSIDRFWRWQWCCFRATTLPSQTAQH